MCGYLSFSTCPPYYYYYFISMENGDGGNGAVDDFVVLLSSYCGIPFNELNERSASGWIRMPFTHTHIIRLFMHILHFTFHIFIDDSHP